MTMSGDDGRRRRSLQALACASMLMLQAVASGGSAAAEASALFADLSGSWAGNGTMALSGGTNERLRCRAKYSVDGAGTGLKQELRCASDSYRFDVASDVYYNAGAGTVSGTWAETNYSAGGFLKGSVSGNEIKARVEGKSFAAVIVVTMSGSEQSVVISPTGTDVTEVSVKLSRAAK